RAGRDPDQEQRRPVDEGPRRLRPRVQRHRVQEAEDRGDRGLDEQDHATRPLRARGREASQASIVMNRPNLPPDTTFTVSTTAPTIFAMSGTISGTITLFSLSPPTPPTRPL